MARQPPRPLPSLGPGLHRDDTGGGLLSIQAEVDDGAQRGLFDDVVGPGGVWTGQTRRAVITPRRISTRI
jgi:hypothetical protein